MLKNTFQHIPGIGAITEEKIWDLGILSWDSFRHPYPDMLPEGKISIIERYLKESEKHLSKNDPAYFSGLIPSGLQWRMFPEFRDLAVYLDIETTGLGYYDSITTIALFDGRSISWYVNGQNLDDFVKDIFKYRLIISYNGKSFDIPFIERFFSIKLDHAHIDLRFVLSSLGYKGGLKACETALGIDRGDIKGIDGFFAVLLWNDYLKNENQKSLETLLAYNIEDVVNLEKLMTIAYNMNISNTPFSSLKLHEPQLPLQIPFKADKETVERIKNRYFY
ncbi:MAG: ribonuclease H-like domain-containing protein [Desulfobacterales bacterium]|nr:ribonuclease H-like domain-containing protein [Desulfobacterales bacterium]MDX2508917.1 ribonuclease H-like domain-containing protein [Desulfobacterales bacterium]